MVYHAIGLVLSATFVFSRLFYPPPPPRAVVFSIRSRSHQVKPQMILLLLFFCLAANHSNWWMKWIKNYGITCLRFSSFVFRNAPKLYGAQLLCEWVCEKGHITAFRVASNYEWIKLSSSENIRENRRYLLIKQIRPGEAVSALKRHKNAILWVVIARRKRKADARDTWKHEDSFACNSQYFNWERREKHN